MMQYLFLFLAVIVSLVLQSTYLEGLKVMGMKPDLVMLLVIFYAIGNGPRKGAIFGLIAGLVQDLFAAKFLGLHAIMKLVIGLFSGTLEKRVYKENVFVPAFLSIFVTYFQEASYIVMRQLAGFLNRPDANIPFLEAVSILAVYNFFLAILGYAFYYKLTTKKIFPRHERRY